MMRRSTGQVALRVAVTTAFVLWAVPGAAWAKGGQWALAEGGTTCFNLLVDSPVEGPRIQATRQPLQEAMGEREVAYASAEGAGLEAGQRWQVVRNTGVLRHPATDGVSGQILEILGVVEVLDADATTGLLVVTGACREFEVGDVLRPLPEAELPAELPHLPVFDDKMLVTPDDADAFVVMGALESVLSGSGDMQRQSMTQYTIYGQRDLVVMDQGSSATWQVGDVALMYRDRIYAESDLLRDALVVPPVLGRAVVVRADTSSAVLQIVDSVTEMQVGDRARKIGTVWDYVNTPPSITCRAERATVRYGESVRLSATVNDADGDPTSVSWRTGAGSLSGTEGSSVTWTADPLDRMAMDAGSVDVIAVVDDRRDEGMVPCTVSLSLAPPPAAQGGAVTPSGGMGAGEVEILNFECPEFPAGVTTVDNRCKAVLDDVALRLRQDPRATAELVGHSDSSGSDEINATTSRQRAESARDYLVETHGIDAARISASGAGSAQPVAENDTPEGRLRNRRVVVRVTIPGE